MYKEFNYDITAYELQGKHTSSKTKGNSSAWYFRNESVGNLLTYSADSTYSLYLNSSAYKKMLPSVYREYCKTITKAAAIASSQAIGSGQEEHADSLAVESMREVLGIMPFSARIVIGEGERDKAPMLYIGEMLGSGEFEIDVAVDPLEGTTLCANGMPGAMSVMAIARRGGLLHAPDVYMQKIVVNADVGDNTVTIEKSFEQNLKDLSQKLKKPLSQVTVCMLNRARHRLWIEEARALGVRVKLISDGDVLAGIQAGREGSGIDIYYGIGGAPEGVLAAAAVSCFGGFMECKLLFENEAEKMRASNTGITNFDALYRISDMVKGDTIFCATGVTDSDLIKGVNRSQKNIKTSHIVMHREAGYMGITHDTNLINS